MRPPLFAHVTGQAMWRRCDHDRTRLLYEPARAALAQSGVGCRWAISPGLPHAIAPDAIATAGRFLRDAFAGRLQRWPGPEPSREPRKS